VLYIKSHCSSFRYVYIFRVLLIVLVEKMSRNHISCPVRVLMIGTAGLVAIVLAGGVQPRDAKTEEEKREEALKTEGILLKSAIPFGSIDLDKIVEGARLRITAERIGMKGEVVFDGFFMGNSLDGKDIVLRGGTKELFLPRCGKGECRKEKRSLGKFQLTQIEIEGMVRTDEQNAQVRKGDNLRIPAECLGQSGGGRLICRVLEAGEKIVLITQGGKIHRIPNSEFKRMVAQSPNEITIERGKFRTFEKRGENAVSSVREKSRIFPCESPKASVPVSSADLLIK